MKVKHELEPIYNKDSEILILGTMPSVKSREIGFYYMHSKNRFWKILSFLYNEELLTIEDKKEFLKRKKIALWDVIASCEINGSSDNSIKNVKVNNLNKIIKSSNIKKIYTTGKTAYKLYNKYCLNKTKIKAICLPSPSPANEKFSLEELISEYKIIKEKE